MSGWQPSGPYAMAVILLARRPFAVIGSESTIELCPYVVEVGPPRLFADDGATVVRAASHHHAISRELLARMAGLEAKTERPSWTLVGAGSLGSKVALHLARAGSGPSVVVDRSGMAPHNAARHALVPATGEMQVFWTDTKARMLSQALEGLNQTATPITADAVRMLMSGEDARRAWPRKSWVVLNATASPVVREAFGTTDAVPARVVETSLFAGGRLGAITVEGPDRNPCTTDLMADFYAILKEQPDLASIVFGRDASVSRQVTGQGCGSLTMTMTDGRLSRVRGKHVRVSAGQAARGIAARGWRGRDRSIVGRWTWPGMAPPSVARGHRGSDNQRERLGAFMSIRGRYRKCRKRWLAGRMSKPAACSWEDCLRSRAWPMSSTWSRRRKTVVARATNSFSARRDCGSGCRGIRRPSTGPSTASGHGHSHLSPGGPSAKDRATARAVALARLTPSIFLVMTPTGFHALAAGT